MGANNSLSDSSNTVKYLNDVRKLLRDEIAGRIAGLQNLTSDYAQGMIGGLRYADELIADTIDFAIAGVFAEERAQADARTPEPAAEVPTDDDRLYRSSELEVGDTVLNQFQRPITVVSIERDYHPIYRGSTGNYQRVEFSDETGWTFIPGSLDDHPLWRVVFPDPELTPIIPPYDTPVPKPQPALNSIDQLPPAIQAEIRDLDKQLDALDIDDPAFHDKLNAISNRKEELKAQPAPKPQPAKLSKAQRAALELAATGAKIDDGWAGNTRINTIQSLVKRGYLRRDIVDDCWYITPAGRAALKGAK